MPRRPSLLTPGCRARADRIRDRQRRHPHDDALQSAHQRNRVVHLYGERLLRWGGARKAELVPSRLAAQRADQDGSETVRHHLGGLSRVRVAASRRCALRLSLAADQRDAAPPFAPGGRTFAAYARQRDRRAFHRHRDRGHSRHRDADAGGRRRILPDRFDALGAHRHRDGALLAAHEPQGAGAPVPRRQDGLHPRRRPANARL